MTRVMSETAQYKFLADLPALLTMKKAIRLERPQLFIKVPMIMPRVTIHNPVVA